MNSKALAVGDSVSWRSQAGGFGKDKTGQILAVVLPDLYPLHRSSWFWSTHHCQFDGVGTRSKVSYLVEVVGGGKPKLYWPRTGWLRKVDSTP